jgi:hypothetical protein
VYPTDLVQLQVREGGANGKAGDAMHDLGEDGTHERPVAMERES